MYIDKNPRLFILKYIYKLFASIYNSVIHFLFPNKTYLNKYNFIFIDDLEKNFQALKDEFLIIYNSKKLPYIDDIFPETTYQLNLNKNWRSFFLKSYFYTHDKNLELLPKTKELLSSKNVYTAFYSMMEPNSKIAPHVGHNKGLIRILLPLKVPKIKEKCFIVVNGEKRIFEECNSLVFDDYYEHYVVNNTNEDRIVLFIDYIRPLPFPFNHINYLALLIISKSAFIKKMRVKSDQLS
jgi:aspartyl/asparaginyl beta-hydroxylase (cupin superfamily)